MARSERMAELNRQAIDTVAALRAIRAEGFTGQDIASIVTIDGDAFESGLVGLASTIGILTNTVIDRLVLLSAEYGVTLTPAEVYDQLRATVGQPTES